MNVTSKKSLGHLTTNQALQLKHFLQISIQNSKEFAGNQQQPFGKTSDYVLAKT
jgi:hypothetical protein